MTIKTKILVDLSEEISLVTSIIEECDDGLYLSEHEIIGSHLGFLLLDEGHEHHCVHVFKQAGILDYEDASDFIHDVLVGTANKIRLRVEDCHEIQDLLILNTGHCEVETKLSGKLLREEGG